MTTRYEVKIGLAFSVYAKDGEEAKRLVLGYVKRVMTTEETEVLSVAESPEVSARLVQDYGSKSS